MGHLSGVPFYPAYCMLNPKLKFQQTEVTHLQQLVVYKRIIAQLNRAKYKIVRQGDAEIAFIKDTYRTSARAVALTHVNEGNFQLTPATDGLMVSYTYYVPLFSSAIIFMVGIALAILVNAVMLCIAAIPVFISLVQLFTLKDAAKDMMAEILKA